MLRLLLLSALMALYARECDAQQTGTPLFRVALRISGDSVVASEIESSIRHELSLLKNVEITDSKPDYTLNAIAMVVQNKEQAGVGIAFTWLSLYHPKGFLEACSLLEDYRLLTFDKEDTRIECQKLVAQFDSKSIEPHRKVFQKPKPF